MFHAVFCCCRVSYPPGRRSACYRFIVSLSFIELSKPLSKYRTFFGSIIFIFVERYIESFGTISNTVTYIFCIYIITKQAPVRSTYIRTVYTYAHYNILFVSAPSTPQLRVQSALVVFGSDVKIQGHIVNSSMDQYRQHIIAALLMLGYCVYGVARFISLRSSSR